MANYLQRGVLSTPFLPGSGTRGMGGKLSRSRKISGFQAKRTIRSSFVLGNAPVQGREQLRN